MTTAPEHQWLPFPFWKFIGCLMLDALEREQKAATEPVIIPSKILMDAALKAVLSAYLPAGNA